MSKSIGIVFLAMIMVYAFKHEKLQDTTKAIMFTGCGLVIAFMILSIIF